MPIPCTFPLVYPSSFVCSVPCARYRVHPPRGRIMSILIATTVSIAASMAVIGCVVIAALSVVAIAGAKVRAFAAVWGLMIVIPPLFVKTASAVL